MGLELQDASDGVLAVAASRRHRGALSEIYRRHAPAAYALARRLLAERRAAEEVVEAVFMDLRAALDSFDPSGGSLRPILLTQTFRIAADHGDSARAPERPRDGCDDECGPEDASAWRGLTTEERDAVELARFPGCTYRDVAMLLGRPEATVKASIRTGLTRIRSPQEPPGSRLRTGVRSV